MKTKRALVLPGLLLVLLCPAISLAAELGCAAPPLRIAQWARGSPVDLAAGKGRTVFVIEFWATWCSPCIDSIPHLSGLQKKFKERGVVVVGVTDETRAEVQPFVEKMGGKMDYVVAIDQNKQTSRGYMGAFNVGGIPHAFVVDRDGRILWHGHPMAGLDDAVTEVVDGRFDLAKARKREVARGLYLEFYNLVENGRNHDLRDELGRRLEALDQELGGIFHGTKFNAAEVRKAVETEQLCERYVAAITANTDRAAIDALGRQIAAAEIKNPKTLNDLAWIMLTGEKVKHRDLPLATTLALAAVDASAGKDASILDTYARALFDTGQVAEAIACQRKAVALAGDAETKALLEEALKRYQTEVAAR